MWSAVMPDDTSSPAPSARAKHTATLLGESVYVLGGRNGNLPLKDFWRYNLVSGKWQQLKPSGERLPCLQEHTAVAYKENIFVFGGEVSFSSSTETPLWVYDTKGNSWRKVKTKKDVVAPKGRRGHTALVHNGSMLIYGGYQDLKGSSGELWAFQFDTESWHLISAPPNKSHADQIPSPRHKHSAVIHGEAIWIYGGMTDLQERGDFWKWDMYTRTWSNIKTKVNPGTLHSHSCCKLPSSMIIFGGERNGQICNDLWKFSFDTELWERITISGPKPQPRSESRSFIVSELILKGSSRLSLEARSRRIRARTCNSADRGNRHSSYLPNNRIAPCESTYTFEPTEINYTDGSSLAQQYAEPNKTKSSLLQEITKLSQINLQKMNAKCGGYTVLTKAKVTDSTESLLRQHSSSRRESDNPQSDVENLSTPRKGSMVKSKSAYVIKKKYLESPQSSDDESKPETVTVTRKKRVDFASNVNKIPREPISVPNFTALTLPTPVLTPVEASKLVYLTDEETDIDTKVNTRLMFENEPPVDQLGDYETLTPLKRGDSYSSHLAYADNPLYQEVVAEKSQENVSSTSDYCSIETVNRLSSASNYSVKTSTPQEEASKNRGNSKDEKFGFCNPNYMGPAIKSMLTTDERHSVKTMLTAPSQPDKAEENEEVLELVNFEGNLDRNTKVVYRQSCRSVRPWNLALNNKSNVKTKGSDSVRAQSAGRAERNKHHRQEKKQSNDGVQFDDPFVPLYVYIVGGKEQGHVTVFQRPISIWRLKLF